MPYDRVQFPFAQGQDERYDRKLLPDGTMSSVVNMRLERDGRMARRQKLVPKSMARVDGDEVGDLGTVLAYTRNGMIVESDYGNVRNEQWVESGGEEFLSRSSGLCSTVSSVEHFNATVDTDTPNSTTTEINTQVDIRGDGKIVFAFSAGAKIQVELRDPDNLAVLARYTKDLFGVDDAVDTVKFKMVASKFSNSVVISYPHSYLLFEVWVAVFVVDLEAGEEGVVLRSENSVTGYHDMIAHPTEDAVIVAHADGLVEKFPCDGSASTVLSPTASLTGTSVSISCSGTRWFTGHSTIIYGYGYTATQTLKVRSGGLAGGAVISYTIPDTYLAHAPTVVETDINGTYVIWHDLEISPAIVPGTYMSTWDIATNTLSAPVKHGAEVIFTHAVRNGSGFSFLGETGYQWGDDFVEVDGWPRELIRPANVVTYSPGEAVLFVDSAAVVTGSRCWDTESAVTNNLPVPLSWWSYPRPVAYSSSGKDYIIYPALVRQEAYQDQSLTSLTYSSRSLWVRTESAGKRTAVRVRDRDDAVSGGMLRNITAQQTVCGFSGPPISLGLGGDGGGANIVITTAVLEYTSGDGRIWRSAPAAPITTNTADASEFGFYACHSGVPNPKYRCTLAFYSTDLNGAILYRRGEVGVSPGDVVSFTGSPLVDAVAGVPVIYTTSEIANAAPPACEFTVVAKGRLWAGGLIQRNTAHASKVIRDTHGIEWSELDSFKVYLPAEVTGMAAMDSSMVIFTRDEVYAVHGDGPDNAGIGNFSEPQLIPSASGCINHRSVVSTAAGVFFQSTRGIEIVPRGMAAPQWVGQAVRNTVGAYPICMGAVNGVADWTVRWLFMNETGTASRVIVYDQRAGAWYTFNYAGDPMGEAYSAIGVNSGIDGETIIMGDALDPASSGAESLETGAECLMADTAYLETGDIRFSSIQGWAGGRRVNLLGHFGGRDCTVKLDFAFDGNAYLPIDTFSWTITAAEYGVDVPIELELTLPVQLFSSARFRVTVDSLSDTESSLSSFKPNGMSVDFTPRAQGPRLAARNTG